MEEELPLEYIKRKLSMMKAGLNGHYEVKRLYEMGNTKNIDINKVNESIDNLAERIYIWEYAYKFEALNFGNVKRSQMD